MQGSIDVKEEGTLLLTIPYDEGWTITVDGETTQQYAIGKALTGIHLTEGTHDISMKYTPPGFRTGCIISLLCLLLFLLSGFLEKRNPRWFVATEKEAPVMSESTAEETASFIAESTAEKTASFIAESTAEERASFIAESTAEETASFIAESTAEEAEQQEKYDL